METVDDILKEMRQHYGSKIREYSYRIELAHAELMNKIQQLESALKPVLECDTSVVLNFEETQIVTGHDVAIAALYAIDEANTYRWPSEIEMTT